MIFNSSTILAALLGAAACLASPAADPAPEEVTIAKRALLSDIDVTTACKQQYCDEYAAITTGNGCNDWKCVFNDNSYGVDLNKYCARRWGSGAYASCSGNVFGWRCYDRR